MTLKTKIGEVEAGITKIQVQIPDDCQDKDW